MKSVVWSPHQLQLLGVAVLLDHLLLAGRLQILELPQQIQLRPGVPVPEQRGRGDGVRLHLTDGVVLLGQDVLQLLLVHLKTRHRLRIWTKRRGQRSRFDRTHRYLDTVALRGLVPLPDAVPQLRLRLLQPPPGDFPKAADLIALQLEVAPLLALPVQLFPQPHHVLFQLQGDTPSAGPHRTGPATGPTQNH